MSALRISVPGRPIQIVADFDEARLTKRQRQTLDALRAHSGDRRRAARALGISKEGLEGTIRRIRTAGASVPPGRGTRLGIPNDRPRDRLPRCGKALQRRPGICGLPELHRHFCRSEEALARDQVRKAAWNRRVYARGRAA